MRASIGLVAFLFGSIMAAQIERIDRAWVFVSHPLHWEPSPPEIENRKEATSVTIIVLYPSGKYGEVSCTVYRGKDNLPILSREDSHVVRVGTWKRADRGLTIRARTVYADALPSGKPIPGPETISLMERPRGMDGWRIQGQEGFVFRPFSEFTDVDYLASTIACHRSYWNGHAWVEPGELPCAGAPQGKR